MSGTLYICSTPIGNMEDITLRALRVFKEVDLIAAEDTRTAKKLLNHYEINTPVTSYHEHNEKNKAPKIIELLLEGRNIALISEAGTPGISDPGYELIREAVNHGIKITVIPGPSALISGLVVSGLPMDRFAFEGFLPRKRSQRRQILENLKNEPRTLIFYESPHRLEETLEDMKEIFNDRRAVLARELTKIYEEILRGNLGELLAAVREKGARGEYVLVVEGAKEQDQTGEIEEWQFLGVKEHVKLLVKKGYTKAEAVKEAARLRGLPKGDVYKYVTEDELNEENSN
ncbi:MAG TPA: 16S rRNA (cytidine(1402)-2'-O)-methyltransferase [Peptococcaceae bacterium]|nr:MAG: Ribosomal RNA small subunit methyltransferase I [Clostridia bacterium 41_269]HBT20732.1 16S rRNA (cytidine(1402)-2'-O)-methyltransferase [Peptococcaceae bacterium]